MQYQFEKLDVWKIGMKVVQKVYNLSKKFPKDEQFGLTNQMRRAAVSITLNLAEGTGRMTKKDFASFVRNAIGSCLEVNACAKIAVQENYVSSTDIVQLDTDLQELYFKMIALDKSLRR